MEKKAARERKWFWGLFFLLIAAICAVGVIYITHILKSAPQISTLDAVPKGYRSSVLDDAGDIVLTLSDENSNRVYVKLSEIPEDLQHAVVAIEDERFYNHHGVDVRGIVRAVFRGIKNGGITEGASTITQQLLKNNVFSGWTDEVTFEDRLERKIQEQFLALSLEKKVSKNWILENYLNTINLGSGNLGVETAARYYFDKDVSELNLSECAALAAVIKNPTKYNPLREPEENAARRRIVLDKMLEQEYITQTEYDEALADDVYARIETVSDVGRTQEIFTWFEDSLIYAVIEDLENTYGYTEDEAWDLLYTGGLTIESTENTAMQTIAEETAQDDTLFKDTEECSIVVIDNKTGRVKAMVGGRGEKEASLLFNRASQMTRQPGSTIKVLGPYAAALENGAITLGTTYDDAPYTYSNGTEVVNSTGTYGGMTTVRSAITSSNNIVALKCFQETGVDTVFSQLTAFGISTLTDEDRVEALALGGTYDGVTNLEMTSAYSAIARGGTYIEPVYYTRVLDREGEVLLENTPETHTAVRAETAALLTSAMSDVVAVGTGKNAEFAGMALAGKSGTTNDVRDAWFVGYSPYLTCGVWGGYDDNSPQEESGYIQIVWRNVMSGAHAGMPAATFEQSTDGEWATICTKCGKLAKEGICDHTEQGNMTTSEYFLAGTAPKAECDCHIEVTVCSESGEKAGRYCTGTETKVYLAKATEGTADEAFVLPTSLKSGTCSTHKHIWSGWFGSGGTQETPGGDTQETPGSGTQETPGGTQETPGGGTQETPDDTFWNWFLGN